jgi:hypothetical protein
MKKKSIILIFSIFYITVCVSQTRNEIIEILNFINADSIKRTVLDLQNFGSRRADRPPTGNLEVAQYLVNRLKAYGIENAHIDSFTYDYWTVYNVRGTMIGEIADSTVIIGAHLDCRNSYDSDLLAPAPGADDNATGCAQTIEMARVLFEKNAKPRYNIDFMAYDYEEFGLVGARVDAQKRSVAGEKVIVMLNNDMVGFQPEDEEWKLTLHWYDNALDVTDKAIEYCYQYTFITPVKSEPGENYSMHNRSDSYAYFENGFKATFNIEFTFSPYYHQAGDLLDVLNFEYQKQVAHLNLALTIDYAMVSFNTGSVTNYDNSLSVFPNPAKDFLRVHSNAGVEIRQIDIYDITGRLMMSLSGQMQHQNIIRIDHFSKGVYLMRISTDKGVMNRKIVKN